MPPTTKTADVNERLHRARGLCWHEKNVLEPNTCYKCGGVFKIPQVHPAYDSDLAAAFELQAFMLDSDLTCKRAERYVIALCKEVGIDTARWEREGSDGWRTILISAQDGYMLATATARQRRDACAIALGIEGEEEKG